PQRRPARHRGGRRHRLHGGRPQGHPPDPHRGRAGSSRARREEPPMTTVDQPTTTDPEPPWVSGGEGETGHLEELRTDPIALMERVRAECGDVGQFRLADKELVLLSGAEANELFFRATDEELDQAAAYPFMTPVFGEGVVFDASPERRREQLHNMALRDKHMRGHAETIQREV